LQNYAVNLRRYEGRQVSNIIQRVHQILK